MKNKTSISAFVLSAAVAAFSSGSEASNRRLCMIHCKSIPISGDKVENCVSWCRNVRSGDQYYTQALKQQRAMIPEKEEKKEEKPVIKKGFPEEFLKNVRNTSGFENLEKVFKELSIKLADLTPKELKAIETSLSKYVVDLVNSSEKKAASDPDKYKQYEIQSILKEQFKKGHFKKHANAIVSAIEKAELAVSFVQYKANYDSKKQILETELTQQIANKNVPQIRDLAPEKILTQIIVRTEPEKLKKQLQVARKIGRNNELSMLAMIKNAKKEELEAVYFYLLNVVKLEEGKSEVADGILEGLKNKIMIPTKGEVKFTDSELTQINALFLGASKDEVKKTLGIAAPVKEKKKPKIPPPPLKKPKKKPSVPAKKPTKKPLVPVTKTVEPEIKEAALPKQCQGLRVLANTKLRQAPTPEKPWIVELKKGDVGTQYGAGLTETYGIPVDDSTINSRDGKKWDSILKQVKPIDMPRMGIRGIRVDAYIGTDKKVKCITKRTPSP